MATDLVIAIAVMTIVSAVCGWIAARLAYSDRGQWNIAFLAVAVLSTVFFLFYGSGQLFWARLVPLSAAIIYTNLSAIFAALAAGWAWRVPETPAWRRGLLVAALGAGAMMAITWPLLSIAVRPPPAGGDHWENGVALQTSWATCSPAAAATLFRAEGIPVSEAEMIPLCLTDASGTPTLGVYRGIKQIADRNAREVVLVGGTGDDLIAEDDWPVLLAVELPYGVDDRRYVDQWGWIPGMGHSVVALGTTPAGDLLIGDPSVGLELWTEADLRVLWHGAGIRVK
ncbi:peptidase C39 [Stieleria mannarensis]|uniref:peptidase C39 n=1 Tax=Stieleria mannarensis TaxID=2755585 RepID=UPI001600F29D|nr:peptidase C39 [Rhodopirellula sp. JC639]